MSEDEKALLYNLRSLARMEHADLSIGDEAADEIERIARERDEARAEIKRMRGALQISVDELLATIDAALAPATPPARWGHMSRTAA
jgi:uncharacterized coiled-coil DUF342 family protein